MRRPIAHTLQTSLVLLVILASQTALAQSEAQLAKANSSCEVRERHLLVIIGKSGTCHIPVYEYTEIWLPDNMSHKKKDLPGFQITHEPDKNKIKVKVKSQTSIGATGVVKLLGSDHTATIVLHVVGSRPSDEGWTLTRQTLAEVAAKKAAVAAKKSASMHKRRADEHREQAAKLAAENRALQGSLGEKDRQLKMCQQESDELREQFQSSEAQRRKAEEQIESETAAGRKEERERALMEELASSAKQLMSDEPDASQTLVPHPDDRATFRHRHLGIQFERARWKGDWFLFHTKLSTNDRPFRLAKSTVQTKDGRTPETRFAFPRAAEDQEIFARILPNQPQDVAIAVKLAGEESFEGLRLKLSEPGGKPLVTAQIPRYRDDRILVPVTEAEERAERLEKERQQRAQQVMVGVSGSVGAFWIADGLGAGELEATSFTGFGIRVTKGISELLAFEAELAGGSTKTAHFENMTINDTEGELTRSASFGRAGFGGLVRFGDKITPYARVGLAGQVARFEAAFTEVVDMDESSYELTALVTFGGGAYVRFAGNFLAGVALSLETPLGGSDGKLFGSAVSLDAHIAYSW